MIIGSKLIFVKNLPSTNTHAGHLLKTNDLPEGTIIYTNYQSAGRGQPGNIWESENGKNLLLSIIIFPKFLAPADQFLISMAISTGICDFLRRYIPVCSIKWPNDIYINNDKIAGILIENSLMGDRIEHSIAGIGLNINQVKFISDAPNPVSLKQITGVNYEITACISQLASDLDKRYRQLLSENYSKIRNDYISDLYRLNEWCNFKNSEGIYTGRILSVTESGRLLIERKSGLIDEYSFKEIGFIP